MRMGLSPIPPFLLSSCMPHPQHHATPKRSWAELGTAAAHGKSARGPQPRGAPLERWQKARTGLAKVTPAQLLGRATEATLAEVLGTTVEPE